MQAPSTGYFDKFCLNSLRPPDYSKCFSWISLIALSTLTAFSPACRLTLGACLPTVRIVTSHGRKAMLEPASRRGAAFHGIGPDLDWQ
jgi:hypothetical protein